jgi:hypothetical protein
LLPTASCKGVIGVSGAGGPLSACSTGGVPFRWSKRDGPSSLAGTKSDAVVGLAKTLLAEQA